jgi:DNA repair exonuclease SbcCD ATPase subunit
MKNIHAEKRKHVLETKLKHKDFSTSYKAFKSTTEKLRNRLDNVNIETPENMNEESLRNEIANLMSVHDRYNSIVLKIESLQSKIKSYEMVECPLQSSDEIEINISAHKSKISELEQMLDKHNDNLKKIDLYTEYMRNVSTYDNWKNKISELESSEIEARNKHGAAMQLKEKILEAESISIINIISSINTHAQLYLDYFFTDNPINIRLVPFKEVKKSKVASTKPQINMEINYKDIEYDVGMLSGGELSRVVLAFTLALSEMFNTPLLMLDECTASLDQDMTATVFDSIKDNFKGKLVLIVAHQVITGTFDKIIKLID